MTISDLIQALGFAVGILTLALAILVLASRQSKELKYRYVKHYNKGMKKGYELGYRNGKDEAYAALNQTRWKKKSRD